MGGKSLYESSIGGEPSVAQKNTLGVLVGVFQTHCSEASGESIKA